MHYSSRRVPAVLALCAVAAACSSSKGTAPAPTGSLTVTINAANGTTPSVVITGPKLQQDADSNPDPERARSRELHHRRGHRSRP